MNRDEYDAVLKRGIRLGLEAASTEAVHWVSFLMEERVTRAIRALNPDTIAREATLNTLTAEAQAQNMGYDNDPR